MLHAFVGFSYYIGFSFIGFSFILGAHCKS